MWDRIKWKLRNFMIGRNGNDDLNRCIVFLALLFDIIYVFVKAKALYYIAMALLFIYIYRMLSTDLARRQSENDRFMGWVQLFKLKWSSRREYVVFRCKCGRNIRVPRHRGKLEVTCPNCRKVKIVYTGRKKK